MFACLKQTKSNAFKCLMVTIAAALFLGPLATTATQVHAASPEVAKTTANVTDEERAVAAELPKMFVDGNLEDLDISYLISTYGKEEIQETERFIGIAAEDSAIFPLKHRVTKRDLKSIGNCMLGKLGDDIRGMVDVNTIVAYIDKKLWLEAAKAIVAKIAAQGIKRNAAVMAGLIAWYATQCGMGW